MREILFRGKHNSRWCMGGLLYDEENNKAFIAEYFEDDSAYLRKVNPETVGQYTGLTDKNGKKIFEGDILDCGDRVVFVKWHDYCGTWDCDFIKYKGERCSNGVTPAEWKYRAVIIGNIHDIPNY